MKCVFDGKEAEYMYKGNSLCKECKDKQLNPNALKDFLSGF